MNKSLIVLLALLALPWIAVATPVNINSADAATIASELKGIGPSKAKAIVEYRQKHGPFKSADDLTLVKGIGDKTIEGIRQDILVEPVKKK